MSQAVLVGRRDTGRHRRAWGLLWAGVMLAAGCASAEPAPESGAFGAQEPGPVTAPGPAPDATPAPASAPSAGVAPPPSTQPPSTQSPSTPRPSTPPPSTLRPSTPLPAALADGAPLEVAYRLERRSTDPATADFEAVAQATLADPRGWARAGFRLVRRADARHVVVLAEGPEVDALCLPYDTYGQYSCQNGPIVALNADRWRTATPKWTGSLDDYRRYLVGHEVGHLLGLRHPKVQCPQPGRPAPLLAQQSTELDGCLPNPWPLDAEVRLARRRPADLAPPYRR